MSYVVCYAWRGIAVDNESGEPNIQIDVSEDLIDILIFNISDEIAEASRTCNSLEGVRKLGIASKNLRNLLTAKDVFREFRIQNLSKPVEESEEDDEG